MHIADGIVSIPVLAATSTFAAAGLVIGTIRMQPENMPRTAMMTTALFLASLVHIPAGPVQFHLVLNGLSGMLLGWFIFPAMAITLLLQALLFGYGGLSSLGVNIFIMATPGLLSHGIFRLFTRHGSFTKNRMLIAGGLAGFTGVAGSITLTVFILWISSDQYRNLGFVMAMLNLPLLLIESLVTASIGVFLARAKPELFLQRDTQ